MTAVRDVGTRSPSSSPAVLLSILGAAVFVPVAIVLVLLLPLWAALLVAIVVAAAVVAWAWTRATSVVRSLGRGRPADPDEHARLINVVEGLCLSVGVNPPAIEVVEDPAANALVAGRDDRDALLLVTSGLLEATDRVELEGIVAHQLVQLRDGSLPAATLTVTTVALPLLIVDRLIRRRWWNGGRTPRDGDRPNEGGGGLGVALLGPASALSSLRRLGVGDERQVWADQDAVALTRFPPGLIGGLEACERVGTVVHAGCRSTAHLWMAEPIATDDSQGALVDRERAFVGPRPLPERIDILRELSSGPA